MISRTWDLSYIFSSDDKWNEEYERVNKEIEVLKEFEGKITESKEGFKTFLLTTEEKNLKVENLYMYAHMNHDANTTVAKYQEMNSKAEGLIAKLGQLTSYVDNEYMANEEKIREYLKENDLKKFTHMFDEIFSMKNHILTAKEEELLANYSEVLDASYNIFSSLNDSDIKFDDVDGEKLNDVTYMMFIEGKDRAKREKAYKNLYSRYHDYLNTYASIMKTNVKNNNIRARLRNYSSARAEAMGKNYIDESIYDNLLKEVNENLYRLHEYMAYKKQKLGYNIIHMYDIYVPTVEEVDLKFTIDEAAELLLEALKPLGEEYLSIVRKCFDEKWIDFEPRDGKRGGAYSSGGFGTRPNILMSWKNNLSSLYTLAHEVGHSIHSYYSRHAQDYTYANYTLFLAEIASTTNENLLTHYLLDKYKDDKKILEYVLERYLDGFRGTVYRQTQFAEFEHLIHELDAKGEVLTAERLSKEYAEINKKYYGPVETDKYISYEWARIPHFYYDFYVYQYATGFSCATYFAKSILEEGKPAVDKYIGYLKSGSSKNSIQILLDAGVDVKNGNVVGKALEEFSSKLKMVKEIY